MWQYGFYACNPRLMSVGGGRLSFPRWVILLFHCNTLGVGRKHVAPESVTPCSFNLELGLFPASGRTVMVDSNWMKTMRDAVSSPVLEFFHLGVPAVTLAATTVSTVGIDVLTIELGGHAGDGDDEFLYLRLHRCQFVRCLNVGCCAGCVVGRTAATSWCYGQLQRSLNLGSKEVTPTKRQNVRGRSNSPT
jgi:hypothetical protein